MKTKKMLLAVAALASVAVSAAVFEEVSLEQQWPWSTEIVVTYRLSDAEKPVCLRVEPYNGEARLRTADEFAPFLSGDLYAVTNGTWSFRFDPKTALGVDKKVLDSFSVKLTTVEDEVLYKIFDLTNGSCADVTRGGLKNGWFGAYETDYGKIGAGYNTSLDDVLIWTGVTNYPGARTTKLVMRKIPAKGKSFTMGSGERDSEKLHTVSFTNDYYMAVFELTEGQFLTVITNTPGSTLTVAGSDKMRFTAEPDRWERPVNVPDFILRLGMADWPDAWTRGKFSNNNGNFIGNVRKLTGVDTFDIPTESVWEYACRAGTSTPLNNGLATSSADEYNLIARNSENSNCNSKNYQDATVLATWTSDQGGTSIVGRYRPNAWGLYDMHGNMIEMCLDHMKTDNTDYAGYTGVDPVGPTTAESDNGNKLYHVGRGGSYWYNRTLGSSAYRINFYCNNSNTPYGGVRLVIVVND